MSVPGRRVAVACQLAGVLLLAGCAGRPPAPDWEVSAHASLQRYQAAWMAGATRAAQAEFTQARRQLASTGQARWVARAELTRCALQVASLDFSACDGFAALEADAGDEERAYAAWLRGQALTPAEVGRLPTHHRRAAVARPQDAAAALQAIDDPLSRLVAAGVQARRGPGSPQLLDVAIETASRQGWRRPLLAWLGLALQRAESAGDAAAAQQIRRRIALAGS